MEAEGVGDRLNPYRAGRRLEKRVSEYSDEQKGSDNDNSGYNTGASQAT